MLRSRDHDLACVVLVLELALASVVPLFAQGRRDLPPPDASRPPLLTTQAPDSIRIQTAHLRMAELLQVLATGDGATLNTLFGEATLEPGTCGNPSEALSRAAARVRRVPRSGGHSLALFFEEISVRDAIGMTDSTGAQVITAQLVFVPASGVPLRNPVTLDLDPDRAVWTREVGLVKSLCDL